MSRALSRLARSERLMRIYRGVYMRPIETRFGLRAPRREKALAALSKLWDATIVPNGGDAANWLGLTTQNAVRSVYLTSGPDRLLYFGAHRVELRHAPSWQLTAPNRNAGTVIRAVAWLAPNQVEESLDAVLPTLSGEDLCELLAARRAATMRRCHQRAARRGCWTRAIARPLVRERGPLPARSRDRAPATGRGRVHGPGWRLNP